MAALREWALGLKRQTLTLYYAVRDPRTPWLARLIAGAVVAYAISPIDLIPDFIPVLGYLDEILLLPLGIWLALRLVPDDVMQDARRKAAHASERPTSAAAAIAIVAVWLLLAAICAGWLYRLAA